MPREARQLSPEEFADNLCGLIRSVIGSGGPALATKGHLHDLRDLLDLPYSYIWADFQKVLADPPMECPCGRRYRHPFHKTCRDCRDAEEARQAREQIEREVMAKYGIKPEAAESAGGGK